MGGYELDSRWKKKEWKTQGDVEMIDCVGDKGERMELGAAGEVGKGQATLAFPGNSLMCRNA